MPAKVDLLPGIALQMTQMPSSDVDELSVGVFSAKMTLFGQRIWWVALHGVVEGVFEAQLWAILRLSSSRERSTCLGRRSSSIRITWPAQRRRWRVMMASMPVVLQR